MKIYLIRHGATDWNHMGLLQGREDIPLNENGKAQAHECGGKLSRYKTLKFKRIITSPLSRAKDTAAIIAEYMKIAPPEVSEGLTERDFGLMSGKKPGDIFNPIEEGNNMESLDDTADRMLSALRAAAGKFNEDFAAVSHGGSINAVLRRLSSGKIGSGKTLLKNVCVSVLDYDGENFTIDGYNQDAGEL